MKPKSLLILGGYGITGGMIAQLLLQETDANLFLAGRSLEKAAAQAAELNRLAGSERVKSLFADAADISSLRKAFQGMDMVIAASSTSQFVREVAGTALEMGLDYLDVQYSTKKVAALQAMSAEISQAGRCFITDGGFHPGLPAALIRYAAPSFDRIETAQVGSVIQIDWRGLPITEATIVEMVEEFSDYQSFSFKDGSWKPANWWSTAALRYMEFGGEFGRRYGMPMFLEELRALPEMYPTLKEVGFYVGSFNWFVDWMIFPLLTVMIKLAPKKGIRPAGKMMVWGLRTFSKPPYGTLLKVEAGGEKEGHSRSVEVTLSHPDGYWFTAIPTVACLLQVLDGSRRQPGLWFQANLVDPIRLMKDMQRMGIEIQEKVIP
jgi:hypothetical protein